MLQVVACAQLFSRTIFQVFLLLPPHLLCLHPFATQRVYGAPLHCPLINQHRVVHALGTDRRTVEAVWEICKGW